MMLDAITFNLGSTCSPTFVCPDVSGLSPLTLPDEFLHGQSHQPQPEFPSDTVRRFETAMSEESKLPPSVVGSLMAHMSSGCPTVAGQDVEGSKVKSPAVEGPKVKSLTVESLKVKNPTVEGLMVESRKSEVASVVNPVSVAFVERPVVVTVDPVVHGDSVVRLADEKRVVASPERPKAPMVAAAEKQTVGIEKTFAMSQSRGFDYRNPDSPSKIEGVAVGRGSMTGDGIIPPRPFEALPLSQGESLMRHPQHSDIAKTFVQSADKPFVSVGERPTVEVVEAPKVVTVEKPVTVAPPAVSTIASVVLENLVNRVGTEEHPVAAISTPIAPVLEPIATVETPVAVDSPIDRSVERSVRVAVEGPVIASVNPMIQEGSVVRSADERPMAATVERPVVVASDKPTVETVEKPVVIAPDKPTVETVEKPVVVASDKPTVVAVEKPVVIAPDKPVVETVEKPVVLATPVAPTIVPVVQENPANRVKAEESPIVASNMPIMSDAPAVRPDAMVEAPVVVEKPFVAPSDNAKIQVIVTTPAEPGVIREKTPVVSAERSVAAKISQQTVATVDKPEEKAVAAAAHVVVAPAAVEASAPQALQVAPEVAAVSAASARTEAIVETVNQIVEAVVGQILVTSGITHDECEIKIMLKPTVLDGSEITMSAKDGTLTVGITPATQEASAAAAAALPRLEIALAEHAPAFHHVSVALQLKKGTRNEAV